MNIVITGASRGIGYNIAKQLAANLDNTVIAIARNQKGLNKLKEEVKDIYLSDNIIPIVFDMEDIIDNSSDLLTEITKHVNEIDVLVNNAGYLGKNMFVDAEKLDIEKIFRINFFAPAELIRILLPLFGINQRSHVVNIGSIGGFQGSAKFPSISYYSASKAAIASLTECLAEELKDKDIAFNCLALGSVQTEMLDNAFPGYKAPLQAHEMAEYIADFALTGYKYFNGKILPVSLSTP